MHSRQSTTRLVRGREPARLMALWLARYTFAESGDLLRSPVAGEKRASQEEVDGVSEAKRTRVQSPGHKENVAPSHVQALATLQKTNNVSWMAWCQATTMHTQDLRPALRAGADAGV